MPVLSTANSTDKTVAKMAKTKKKKKSKEAADEGESMEVEVSVSPKKGILKRKLEEKPESEDEEVDDQNESSSDSEEDSEAEEISKPAANSSFGASVKKFDPKDFRRKLFTRDAGQELKILSGLMRSGGDEECFKNYLSAGGSSGEILEALSNVKNADPGAAIAALRILNSLFLRVLRFHPEKVLECEETAMKLIQSGGNFLSSLLSPKQKSFKVMSGLKVLTAMASLSPRVAKEVIKAISLGKEEIRHLTNRSDKRGEARGSSKIRQCYLHFLMSFLLDKETNTIQLLMAKEDVVGTALLGLIHDPSELVQLVLTAVRTNIVENGNVAKKLKQVAFNTRVLEALVTLYEWQGPIRGGFKKFKKKKSLTIKSAPEDDLKLVQESVHLFLKELLTSYKLGVVYASPNADMPQKHNMQAFTVLKKLQRPWDCELRADLLISVLRACPTLVRPVLTIFSEMLTPRPTLTWLKTLEFLTKVLESVTMDSFSVQEDVKMTPKMLTNMIFSLALPISVLKSILVPGLSHPHAGVKEAVSRLLVCVLTQLGVHLKRGQEIFKLSEKDLEISKNLIQTQLSHILPPVSLVWQAWQLAVPPEAELEIKEGDGEEKKKTHSIPIVEAPKILEMDLPAPESMGSQTLPIPPQSAQLATYLMLLLGYQQWLHHWLEISWGGGKATSVLSSIKKALELLDEKNKEAGNLQVKAISLISSMDSMAIAPNQEFFAWAINVLVHGSKENADARKALSKVLNRLGIMLENEDELNVWFRSCDGRKDCLELISSGIVLLAQNLLDFTEKQYELISGGAEGTTKSHTEQLDEMLGDLEQESDLGGTVFNNPHQNVAFSPLLVVLLQLLTEKAPKAKHAALQFLIPRATVHLLQQQSAPGYMINLVKAKLNLFPSSFSNLIKNPTSSFDELLTDVEQKLVRFLSGGKSKFPEIENESPEQLKQLCHMAVLSCANKVESGTFNKGALSAHWTAVENIIAPMSSNLRIHCLEHIVCHPVLLNAFSVQAKTESTQLVSELLMKIVPLLQDKPALGPLRQKTLVGLKKSIGKDGSKLSTLCWCEPQKFGDLILCLSLSAKETHSILRALLKMPAGLWVQVEHSSSLPVYLLAALMKRILILRGTRNIEKLTSLPFADEEIKICLSVYEELVKNKKADVSQLEDAMVDYLATYPHHIAAFSSDLLLKVLKQETSKGAEFANLLVQWTKYTDLKELEDWAKGVDITVSLPVYQTLLSKKAKDLGQISKIIWPKLQAEITEAITNPAASVGSLFVKNQEAVFQLVNKYLDEKNMSKKTLKLLKENLPTEAWQAELVCELLLKLGNNLPFLTSWLLRSLTKILGTDKAELTAKLCSLLKRTLEVECKDASILSGVEDADLIEFYKATLKHGVGSDCDLLNTLAIVVAKVQKVSSLQTVIGMLLSHSQTMVILLGHEQTKKHGILRLLDVLTESNKSLISAKHVPVFLGAYNATLSENDQVIFKLLMRYEKNGVSFRDLQPLLWGEAAITRYSLRSHLGQSLRNQPSPSEVLHALESGRVSLTLAQYPVDRNLDGSGCEANAKIYDPAFFLPLFAQILSPEALLQPWLFTRNALPLSLMALSSSNEDSRNLALVILSRLYFHYEAGRLTFEKKLWLHFLDTVRNTVNTEEEKQLPTIVALFLARSSLLISNPEHDLYAVINRFLLAKPAIDTSSLPEFLRMMHSSEPGHKIQRQWMLNLLRDGIKTQKDFSLFFGSFGFKILTCLYNSPIDKTDTKMKIDVLQVLLSVAKIPGSVKRLASSSGLMSWIHGAIASLPPAPTNINADCPLSETLLTLLEAIWSFELMEVRESMLFSATLFLEKVPPQPKLLLPLLKILISTFKQNDMAKIIFTEEDLNRLMALCKEAGISNYPDCKDLLHFKMTGDCKEITDDLGRKLREFLDAWIL